MDNWFGYLLKGVYGTGKDAVEKVIDTGKDVV